MNNVQIVTTPATGSEIDLVNGMLNRLLELYEMPDDARERLTEASNRLSEAVVYNFTPDGTAIAVANQDNHPAFVPSETVGMSFSDLHAMMSKAMDDGIGSSDKIDVVLLHDDSTRPLHSVAIMDDGTMVLVVE